MRVRNSRRRHAAPAIALLFVLVMSATASADIDWRTKGVVTNVRDQGTAACNVSWAFGLAGLVESFRAVNFGTLSSLSPQQLIDCGSRCDGFEGAGSCPDASCAPLTCAFRFITENGLCTEATYPYTGQVGTCKGSCTPVFGAGLANWVKLQGEAALASELDAAPVLVRLEIGVNGSVLPSYLAYDSNATFTPPPTDATVVQWALVVGYDADEWIVKNSIGTAWGDNGHLFLVRGQNALGIGNTIYALRTGPAVLGACARPGGSCTETDATGCADAGGVFDGAGTFCPVSCAIAVPALSSDQLAAVMVLLAVTAILAMRRRAAA